MASEVGMKEKHPDSGGISSVPESMPTLTSATETIAVEPEQSLVPDGDNFEKTQEYISTEGEGKKERGGNRRFEARVREHWYQFWRFKNPPPPPPENYDNTKPLPLSNASIFSDWTYSWIEPLLLLGYRRPLEPTDLWKMDGPRTAEHLSSKLIDRWDIRVAKADEYNQRLVSGEIKPSWNDRRKWRSAAKKEAADNVGGEASISERLEAKEYCWKSPKLADIKPEKVTPELKRTYAIAGKVKTKYKRADLFWSMFDIFWPRIAVAYCSKLIADTAYLVSALLMSHIITAITENNRGRASGYSVLMFAILVFNNILSNRFFYESMYIGVFCRAALISGIFRRALKMQGRDRSTGKLVNHVSTDVSRIDFGAQWWLLTFTAPVEVIVCLIILLTQGMGASCLAGFALIAVVMPVQFYCLRFLFSIRKKSMEWTDRRARRTQEVLSGMRIVKLFSYESNFLELISKLRRNELVYVFQLAVVRAGVMAVAISLPLLAGVISIITYYFYHNPPSLNAEVVFPAITLFQILRLPLMFLPFGLSVIADGLNSFQRLRDVFYAQQHDVDVVADEQSVYGLELRQAQFEWEDVSEDATLQPTATQEKKQLKKQKRKQQKMWAFLRKNNAKSDTEKKRRFSRFRRSKNKEPMTDPTMPDAKAKEAQKETPSDFVMAPIDLKIKRGELAAIIGPVGSGKSSLLLGAIGEMQKVSGDVIWGSQKIAYCSQSAWIQNATIRDNILFGQPFDEARYWECIERAELPSDLAILQKGDLTEIGERGVTLSGGQKQRVNIARALYYDADVLCLDDPLSAVDAHVGKALFENAIMPMRAKGKTVLLVTHAIQYLPECDKIIAMDDGRIDEVGTYQELMAKQGSFAATMHNFGMLKDVGEDEDADELAAEAEDSDRPPPKLKKEDLSKSDGENTMELEERNTGSVDGYVYKAYMAAGQGWWTVPLATAAAVCMQGATTLSTYYINWWSEWYRNGTYSVGFCVGLYVMLGMLQLIFNFITDVTLGLFTYMASRRLHDSALKRVIYAPMWWFDTTPLGRIINRFGKDIDVLDNQLSNLLRQCVSTVMSILGAAAMIIALTYYFSIAIVVVLVIAYIIASFYRSSAREFKRMDAMLRSTLYSHFAESLGGLTTIRAYRGSDRFLQENYDRVDLENRAYFCTVANQRWLGLRLDLLGSVCVLVVGLLTSNHIGEAGAGTAGTALSLIITIAQTLGFLTRQLTELENEMNSAERLIYYADTLKQEAPQRIPDTKPPPNWPSEGSVELENVWLKYRSNLPYVLKGLSLQVHGGEKIGIVGRTGAGKSSILSVLLRLSEASRGVIRIDGVDVAKIGLEDLRRAIAILPQEPLLFSGTLRSNLDPFNVYDDSRLWDAMQRAYLTGQGADLTVQDAIQDPDVPTTTRTEMQESAEAETGGNEGKALTRLTLDSIIDEEGANLSVGQRSLVSLARALVRNSKIILLDEATASVDLETDAKIQKTIRSEFADRTLLCIAHRLSTIIGYDRIVVMDDGKVAEFDAPLTLFDQQHSVFRGMCDRSGIKREEVLQARMPSTQPAL
ncbi:hypothetical protein MPSI1_002670 [Malassezia psittaci]|uniref:Abc transporter n=1 Tax=Malassezia psittaci TaxID=1821823 RepID=A0AAF0F7X7_9BASI|nr:hypothetical protein MPSI1_002670 [Malassezia psittaci]